MRAKEYDVMERAVEEGVAMGLRHAYKYNPKPDETAIRDAIVQDVMNSICEWFDFTEPALIEEP